MRGRPLHFAQSPKTSGTIYAWQQTMRKLPGPGKFSVHLPARSGLHFSDIQVNMLSPINAIRYPVATVSIEGSSDVSSSPVSGMTPRRLRLHPWTIDFCPLVFVTSPGTEP